MTSLPTTAFTLQGPQVTRIGLGGEGILRTFGRQAEARSVIEEALSRGITYFDTAPAYSGSQAYLGAVWSERPQARQGIFHTSKSAERSYSGARKDLDNTLQTLGFDSLDLWQIHDVRTSEDIRRIEAQDGALQAFIQAKKEGRVKHIGVTGHHDPQILLNCVRNWPLDSVLLPVNPAETLVGGFSDRVRQEAREKGMAVIGMKCLGGGHYVQPRIEVTAQKLLRYALDTDADLIIVGCSSPQEVQELVSAAQSGPLEDSDRAELEAAFEPNASRLAFYRGSR